MFRVVKLALLFEILLMLAPSGGLGQSLPIVEVERQPLAANLERLLSALDYLGHPLPAATDKQLREAIRDGADVAALQRLVDQHVLFSISVNPELRVKVKRGPAPGELQQAGFTPCLIKLQNDATVTRKLRITSPQSGPVYSGAALGILQRQAQTELLDNENKRQEHRFLQVEVFDSPPMVEQLTGLEVEYLIALIYCAEAGKREATIQFDIGQGTQDLGFRSEVPVLFDSRPALPVELAIHEADGTPTTARLTIRDKEGRVYPPQAKRLAPDFFFQPQVYRSDGQKLWLPPGDFVVTSSRGPEYVEKTQELSVTEGETHRLTIELERWVDPAAYGFYCGDHHIHGAGCSHYDNPTQGVTPSDMFAQVKGEGLNVGCVLTWGPCFDHQRNFFSPIADEISEPRTLLKYDLEISGFGSAALGHVCLLNLKDQTYPGSDGGKLKGWPTWTVPVMRWTKQQGGFTGYPHSALHVSGPAAASWALENYDADQNGQLSFQEARQALMPMDVRQIDSDRNGALDRDELVKANELAADQLPNLALPAMDGGGAMEIFVSTAEGVCDFISAMDTARIPEWNTWYHLMNCGFPLKLSGETDFPCMSSRRVGQGRVYVQLGELPDSEHIDFKEWCRQLAGGNSYVSDGFAHALRFSVEDRELGHGDVHLTTGQEVTVRTTVAFAAQQPKGVAYGSRTPAGGRRLVGDTVNLHGPREDEFTVGGDRTVEVIVNGYAVAQAVVPADGQPHELAFDVPIEASSWVAIRQFPQLHTNPIQVLIDKQPIRASRSSAVWCLESVKRLWMNRARFIATEEREAARQAYEDAMQLFAQRAEECPTDGASIPNQRLPKHR